jgi:hypothetical protein
VCSALAASANPIQMLIVCIAVSLFHISQKPYTPQRLASLLYVLVPALISAYITNNEFTYQPILTAAKIWEDSQHLVVSPLEFFMSLGPIGLGIPFGMWYMRKNHSSLGIILALYGALSIGIFLSPLPALLGTATARWLSPASYGGPTMVGALGFVWCMEWMAKRWKLPYQSVAIVGLTLYLLFTIPALAAQVIARSTPLQTDPTLRAVNYLSMDITEAMVAIQNDEPHDDRVVLTDPALPYDVVVPIFTAHRSFTGHPIHTLYPNTKADLRHDLFAKAMTVDQANRFFTDHTIGYILTTKQNTTIASYGLSVLFENEMYVVYKR